MTFDEGDHVVFSRREIIEMHREWVHGRKTPVYPRSEHTVPRTGCREGGVPPSPSSG
jgi:hypothetical protein